MSWLTRFLGLEKRSQGDTRWNAYQSNLTGFTGWQVDPVRASGLATAMACMSIISQSLASAPLHVYRRTANGGRERAIDHPLYAVLHDQPSPRTTAYELREVMGTSVLIYGNSYSRIDTNSRGEIVGLHMLRTEAVSVEQLPNGRLRYRYNEPRGGVTVLLEEDVLHLRYRLGSDGVMGLSPVQLARETFGVALAQNDAAGVQARHGFRPEGVITFPTMVGAAKTSMLGALQEKIQKEGDTGRVLVLDGGVDWKPMAFSARDAQFLESRKLTSLDICRVYQVPPTVAGILDHGTYSNVEMESRALVTRCLAPMAKRIEQVMNITLLSPAERGTLFIEHDLDGLLRGDITARYEAYRTAREWGWLSVNEIRGYENMPQVEGGDERLRPLNMAPLGTPAPEPQS